MSPTLSPSQAELLGLDRANYHAVLMESGFIVEESSRFRG